MDADRIGLVLAKTSELRSKIVSCIQNKDSENDDVAEETEVETLLSIRDAFESLEEQLSSLQALQQQQWYEKEAALSEIEYSQKKLLKELKEYKGKDLEVIHEAISFASESEDHNDLLLPPYPSRLSPSFPATHKFSQNGLTNNLHVSERNSIQPVPRGPFNRVKSLIGTAAKAALTIVGVITILSLAGFEPRLKKRDNQFKLLDLFRLERNEEEGSSTECPPGKVPVIENGEVRCVVKERVEVPFESVVAAPNVSYGCG